MTYHPKNTCCTEIIYEIRDDIIQSVSFKNGCGGNLQGIAKLVTGMKTTDVIEKLSGITCGRRNTSCPDQLACALRMH